jgi:hypothetical protein
MSSKANALFDVRKCRVCGCTDDDCSGCIARTGKPCRWVERDLCSACKAAMVAYRTPISDTPAPVYIDGHGIWGLRLKTE